jgi:predicted cupin superfamily sugar epimerase
VIDRAAQLVSQLRLAPHPEGGYFREIHRAAQSVEPADGRTVRPALTIIYFLLVEGDVSRWHRVESDESWHFHEGDALELLVMDAGFEAVRAVGLGPISDARGSVSIVPAGRWQAARTTGHYTLVSCAVGPGFVFDDFRMLRDEPADAQRFLSKQPDLAVLL